MGLISLPEFLLTDGGVGYFTVYGQLPSVPAVTDYLIVCWFALKCI